jgi:hypothetical protein
MNKSGQPVRCLKGNKSSTAHLLLLLLTEAPYEVLPRLFQLKFEGGLQEELLFPGRFSEQLTPTGAEGRLGEGWGGGLFRRLF